MNSSENDKLIQEMIDFYGAANIPNPEHYPRQFEFLVKSFQHYVQTCATKETHKNS
jgi:hypothetical protein